MPRIFFALWPDTAVRDRLYRVAQAAHRGSGGRLMRRTNLHQTLVFLGTVADARVARAEAAAAGINAPPFKLEFGTTGYWRRNRIIWAAPDATPQPLSALVDALEDRLAQAGFGFDRRPYSAHVTLVRDARAPTLLPPMRFDWPVREFALVESGRDPHGVAYRVIARWPLSG
jgi:RNA 2',3'-cyclic 3'-phosphodiesterase